MRRRRQKSDPTPKEDVDENYDSRWDFMVAAVLIFFIVVAVFIKILCKGPMQERYFNWMVIIFAVIAFLIILFSAKWYQYRVTVLFSAFVIILIYWNLPIHQSYWRTQQENEYLRNLESRDISN